MKLSLNGSIFKEEFYLFIHFESFMQRGQDHRGYQSASQKGSCIVTRVQAIETTLQGTSNKNDRTGRPGKGHHRSQP